MVSTVSSRCGRRQVLRWPRRCNNKNTDSVGHLLLELARDTGVHRWTAHIRKCMGQPLRVVLTPTKTFRPADTMPYSAEICSTEKAE